MRSKKAKGEKADGRTGTLWHKFIKRQKNRLERKRAKNDPECIDGYRRYSGWES